MWRLFREVTLIQYLTLNASLIEDYLESSEHASHLFKEYEKWKKEKQTKKENDKLYENLRDALVYLDIIMSYQKNEEIDESMLEDLIKTERIKKLSKLLRDPTGIGEQINKKSTEAEILQIFRNTVVDSLIKEKYPSNKFEKREIDPEYTGGYKF